MIHVYALTDPDGPPPTSPGIDDQPIRVVVGTQAAAVVSEHEAAPAPDAAVVLRHAQVVEQVAASRAVLPARFGTGALDEGGVLDRLADPSLPAALDRVRGRVEIAVRLVRLEDEPSPTPLGDPAVEPPRSGREHLARLAARRAAEQDRRAGQDDRLAAMRARLQRYADDVVVKPAGSPRVLWHAALLVPAEERDAFATAVGEVAGELAPTLTVLCTGPWPPYSFTPDQPSERAGGAPAAGGSRT